MMAPQSMFFLNMLGLLRIEQLKIAPGLMGAMR